MQRLLDMLRVIWHDLRRGENIDLYVGICVAVVVAVLGVVGIADESLVYPATLAVLAVLAASMVGHRHRLEGIGQALGSTARHFFSWDLPQSARTELAKRSELWVIGVTLSGRINRFYSLMEETLQNGGSLKVLAISPDGEGSRMAAYRIHGRYDAKEFSAVGRATLARLCELKKMAPDRLTIKTLDYPLSVGGFAADLEDASKGVLFLKYYSFKVPGDLPQFVLRPRDGESYDYFRQEITIMWTSANVWDCESS